MNVFIASAGRRTSLVLAFKQAVLPREGRVYAGDMDGLAPALYLADEAVRLPRISDPDYIETLLDLVERYRIRLLIPTLDTELLLFAQAREAFAERGCLALVSSPELIHITADKWDTGRVFEERGISVPPSWLPEGLDREALPENLFVKPRSGSASQHTYATHRGNLDVVLPRVPNPIIQQEIRAPELTVDALLGLDGTPLHYVPRLRIRTLGGESIQGVTVSDTELRDWLLQVLAVVSELGGIGPFTLQLFQTEDGLLLSEINPRFGGGVPLTFRAGGRYPEWLMQQLAGCPAAPRIGQYQVGLYMTRTYTEHFVEAPLWR